AKFKGMFAKMAIIPVGLRLAMFMHFMWNLTVSFNSTALIGFAFMIMSVIIIFVVFQFAVHNEGKIILRELTDEANTTGYIPREHLAHLPFTSKRGKKGWLANHINHKDYVKTAIKLAIRKNQTKSLKANKQAAYQREVDALRSRIYTMVFYQQQKTQ
ncbi:MAG TPA: hypothetical protein DCX92_13375, partial [Bacteroidetes bacterium]|nr:hypothetical protein [Bacteroidota bacterium]